MMMMMETTTAYNLRVHVIEFPQSKVGGKFRHNEEAKEDPNIEPELVDGELAAVKVIDELLHRALALVGLTLGAPQIVEVGAARGGDDGVSHPVELRHDEPLVRVPAGGGPVPELEGAHKVLRPDDQAGEEHVRPDQGPLEGPRRRDVLHQAHEGLPKVGVQGKVDNEEDPKVEETADGREKLKSPVEDGTVQQGHRH